MTHPIRWCENRDELIDFLAYVSLYAPDHFPDEDGERLDLERAFAELRHGLLMASTEIDEAVATRAGRLMNDAEAHYRDGDVRGGGRALIEAEYLLRTAQ